jgi:superfamily I DNA and/or RNA helicase
MNKNKINWIKYWRNSLADNDRKVLKVTTNPIPITLGNCLVKVPEKHANYLWNIAKPKKDDDKISVDICPVKWETEYSHGKQNKNKEVENYPFWIPATMTKDGVLAPKSNERPFFVRAYLSPNPSNLNHVATLGEVDKALKRTAFKAESWKDYWNVAETFFKNVTNKTYQEFNQTEVNEVYVQVGQLRNVSTNILKLYDHIVELKPTLPLLDLVTDVAPIQSVSLPSLKQINNNSKHVGQMNAQFPLSKSQRETFSAFSSMQKGEVLAVNGPPGTGKTTVLQSFVANLIVERVLEQKPPFLIMASSTNNQAITNILDSFDYESSDSFSNRWLPNLNSFGLFFSGSKVTKYQTCTSLFAESDKGFLKKFESQDIEELKAFFLSKFNETFSVVNSIKSAKTFLLKELKAIDFKSYLTVAKDYEKNKDLLQELNCETIEDLRALLEEQTNSFTKSLQLKGDLEASESKLKEVLENLSLIDRLLFFLPKIKARKKLKFERALLGFNLPFEITEKEQDIFSQIDQHIISNHKEIQRIGKIIKAYKNRAELIETNQSRYKLLIEKWNAEYGEKLTFLYAQTGEEYQNLSPLEDLNVRLDISLRNYAFWLANHYREAEYLELLEKKLKGKENKERGHSTYKKRLERLACITPLFISTFHSLPKFSTYYKGEDLPFFELYDYLIIDEAGQVSPDVALASFSLAKRAVVVGDTLQIEPVWSATKELDRCNLELHGLISGNGDEKDLKQLDKAGFRCSNGSIMQVAQNSCQYEEEGLKGTMLKEHRRCLDSIIDYSNNYVYQNKLLPKVGFTHNKGHEFPPMAYLNIPSESEKSGSSRVNKKEALIIARWVLQNKETLENAYGKKIEKIVGIVTPYVAQAGVIKKCLKQVDKSFDKITVGTVHSLQGAEREIVLFSLVVSKKDPLGFLNSQYNMINVAISRAKHSFLVFGNISTLDFNENSPLGNLKKWLLTAENPELSNSLVYDEKGCFEDSVSRVNSLKQHRSVLVKAIEKTTEVLYLFSPFISSWAIEADNICELISKKTKEGVRIYVVTDSKLDIQEGKLKPQTVDGRKMLSDSGAKLLIVNGIHNKTIVIDDSILIEGSFNWLSAVRDETNRYHRYESSIILQGEEALTKIEEAKKDIEKLILSIK